MNNRRLQVSRPTEWVCPACGHMVQIQPTDDVASCAICANAELYKKKDFPHWLGLTILAAACAAFLVANAFYRPGLAWSILIASAIIDGAFYCLVGDALVCYRCGAQYRRVRASATICRSTSASPSATGKSGCDERSFSKRRADVDDQQRDHILDDLKGIIKGELLFDELSRVLYSTDASIFQIQPAGVVAPSDEEDLQRLVRYAAENRIPLVARGRGQGLRGQRSGLA